MSAQSERLNPTGGYRSGLEYGDRMRAANVDRVDDEIGTCQICEAPQFLWCDRVEHRDNPPIYFSAGSVHEPGRRLVQPFAAGSARRSSG